VVIGLLESLKLDFGKNPRVNATVPIVESKSDLVSFVVSGLAGRLFLDILVSMMMTIFCNHLKA